MRQKIILLSIGIGLALSALPVQAQQKGHVNAGVVVWRHATDLAVERATDFDGSDDTADRRANDWDARGSGMGFRLGYQFPELFSIYGEAGATQTTIRDKDVTDIDQDVESRGLDGGYYMTAGARVGDDFSGQGNLFWSVGVVFTTLSTDLDEDIDTHWDYDATSVAVDGRIGTLTRGVGFYGGLSLVTSSGDLDETDRTRAPGEQLRRIQLERDQSLDLIVGAQTQHQNIDGFVQLDFVGTFQAAAGLSLRF